jgi:hypothetical protein
VPSTSSTDALFVEFRYPDAVAPCGIIETGMPAPVCEAIHRFAGSVGGGLAAVGHRCHCLAAASEWLRVLEQTLRGTSIAVRLEGGPGVDEEDQFDPNYRTIPLDRRSGYREADGLVHRHFWLLIGPDQLVFDPTAHQFDAKGGVHLDRYVLDGTNLPDWRSRESRAAADV